MVELLVVSLLPLVGWMCPSSVAHCIMDIACWELMNSPTVSASAAYDTTLRRVLHIILMAPFSLGLRFRSQ